MMDELKNEVRELISKNTWKSLKQAENLLIDFLIETENYGQVYYFLCRVWIAQYEFATSGLDRPQTMARPSFGLTYG